MMKNCKIQLSSIYGKVGDNITYNPSNTIKTKQIKEVFELETFEDFIDHMIKEGYWAEEDLAPLKCHHCGSKNLEDKHWSYENIGVVEYDRWCNDCDKLVNIWSYGSWNL